MLDFTLIQENANIEERSIERQDVEGLISKCLFNLDVLFGYFYPEFQRLIVQ